MSGFLLPLWKRYYGGWLGVSVSSWVIQVIEVVHEAEVWYGGLGGVEPEGWLPVECVRWLGVVRKVGRSPPLFVMVV